MEPVNVILFGSKGSLQIQLSKMRSSSIKVGTKSNDILQIRDIQEERHRDTEEKAM